MVIRPKAFQAAAFAVALTSWGASALAQSPKNVELLTWLGGPDRKVLDSLAAGFEAKHPDFKIDIKVVTSQGDARGGMRTALLGGDRPDLITNTWPAFRQELADANILRDVTADWSSMGWDKALSSSWRDISTTGGAVYGVPYIFGYRSGIWHVPADLKTIGLSAFPSSFDDFLGTFKPLRNAGFAEPIAMPAKVYAHTEWFETLLLRTGGPDVVSDLGAHKIAWTDPRVAEALRQYSRLFEAGCCADAKLMYATHWDDAADRIFVQRKANFLQIGMWINARAISQYHLKPGTDYALGKFPALGRGFDNASIIDAKEILATNNGENPKGADLFLDYIVSSEGADIIAKAGFTTPSSNVDKSIYDPVAAASVSYVNEGPVRFVLGDMLPGSLVDEYRLALQQFIADPKEANIQPTLERIEAAAGRAY
ncbi:carbohydrate ABC transporter substrate-binding protein (plasmid) [Rhizobium leguminosarum]|nr:carbohydrate ABC transporter substrate-binding protein [Rhizobium leguminosarum]TBG93446.1 carbohydrate ABC transporter substrate-binding protein [Rhizobium leguminosarum]TBG95933.1 carbohydrate ABC transporter substrate-binding protein [Rhizobium leguminosarum]TBH28825.1 carbohydrate ABC transporter substrate-binding protein [Rhizobium leguminosarum]TBH50271.1 carbohydrate ABC transporter substrate-binding protein [Rhizobium leguminosarum]